MENQKTFTDYCKELIQQEKENMKITKLTLVIEGKTTVNNVNRTVTHSMNVPY